MHRSGNGGEPLQGTGIGVPAGWVAHRVLQVAGWALLLQLICRGREGCHFPGANLTVLFPFRETTDRELSVTLGI